MLFSLILWFNQNVIYPDSATYITVAKNYLKYGELFQWVNWPSATYLPIKEPFTDFAPGLSFLLIPIMYIFKEPVLSAVILQSLIIIGYNFIIYFTLKTFNFSKTFIIIGMLLFAFLPNFNAVSTRFLTEIPFISFSLLALALLYKSVQTKTDKYWTYIWCSLFIASSMKYIGIFNIIIVLLFYLFYNMKLRKLIISIIFCALPVVLWFFRNYVLYHFITNSHNLGKKLDIDVFSNIITKLAAINPLLNFILLFVILISFTLLILPLIGKFKLENNNKKIYLVFLITFITHFLGIIVLNTISKTDALGMRLLSPSLAFLLLAIIYLFDYYSKLPFNLKKLRIFINICFVLIIALSVLISIRKLELNFSNLDLPQEKYLWKELNSNLISVNRPSHYYTEFNLTNQIYGELPMRVIYNEKWINKKLVLKLKTIGHQPFYLYSNNNVIAIDALDKLVKEGILTKKVYRKYDISLYNYRNQ